MKFPIQSMGKWVEYVPSEHNRLLTSCHKPPIPQLEPPTPTPTSRPGAWAHPTHPCSANLGTPSTLSAPLPAAAASDPPGFLQLPITSPVHRQLFTTIVSFASFGSPGDRKIVPISPARKLRARKVTQTVRHRTQPRPGSAASKSNSSCASSCLCQGRWSVVVMVPGL